MSRRKIDSRAGFTILEVLAATLIFFLIITAVVSSRIRALRNVGESGQLAQAQALAEYKMTEMEMKYQDLIDKSTVASALGKEEGVFEAPYDTFNWEAELKENPLVITQDQLLAFLKAFGMTDQDSQSQFAQGQLLLSNLNRALKDNMGELVIRVKWKYLKTERVLPLVTHLIPKKPKITFSQNTDIDKDSTK